MNRTENNMKIDVPQKRTYKVDEIAAMLSIDRSSAYNLVKEGHFNTVRIGNTIRVSTTFFSLSWLIRAQD